MKGIHQFAANLFSYIPTKYHWNRSTSDLVIAKSKRVNFFETQCSYTLSGKKHQIRTFEFLKRFLNLKT